MRTTLKIEQGLWCRFALELVPGDCIQGSGHISSSRAHARGRSRAPGSPVSRHRPALLHRGAAIQQALQEHRYNKTKTAAALGITFRALRYKLKKLGID